jgi:hypothetical protein
MAVHVFKATELELNGNQTIHTWWNNATPVEAVWTANVVPLPTGSSTAGFTQDTSVEVKRLWRRLIVTEIKPFPQSQTVDLKVEHEIHYEIANLTNSKARVAVFLCAASP